MSHHSRQTALCAQILEAAPGARSAAEVARSVGCSRKHAAKMIAEHGITLGEKFDEPTPRDHAADDAAYLASLREHHPGGYPSLAIPNGRGAPKRGRQIIPMNNDVNTRGKEAWPTSKSHTVTLARRADPTILDAGRSRSNSGKPCNSSERATSAL